MKTVITRKKHSCYDCGRKIEKGTKALAMGIDAGSYGVTVRLCAPCSLKMLKRLVADLEQNSTVQKVTKKSDPKIADKTYKSLKDAGAIYGTERKFV